MLLGDGFLSSVGVNPSVDQVGYLLHEGQVIATEAVGGLPGIVGVLVEAAERDRVPGAGGGAVHPDRGFDRAEADFVDGLVVHDGFSFAARGSIPSLPRCGEREWRLAKVLFPLPSAHRSTPTRPFSWVE